MTTWLLLWLTSAAFLAAMFTATAARVINQFPRHDLEEYCRMRKRNELFDEIMQRHGQVALAVESLQMVCVTLLVLSASMLLYSTQAAALEFSSWMAVAAVVFSSLLLLVSNSWIATGVTNLWSSPFLFYTWRFWKFSLWIAWPLSIGVVVVGTLFQRLAGRHEEEDDEEEAFDDEIRTMVSAGQQGGLLEADARDMIEGVIELDGMTVDKIMTPRWKIDALDVNRSWAEVLQFVIEVGRTRIPVFERNLDNLLGVLFVKDLLPELAKSADEPRKKLQDLVRPAWFVPEKKMADEMLQDFLRIRNHMAIVMDEYESVAGVVTIEDILEEIVGEIVDETDKESGEEIQQLDESTALVAGYTHVDKLNEVLGLELPEDGDFDTVAGLVINQIREIPRVGQHVRIGKVDFEIIDANRRRVEQVKVVVHSFDGTVVEP